MSFDPATTARLNQRSAALIIDVCIEYGVRHFFVAPGSRSTPLTMEIAKRCADDANLRVTCHFDERGLAFACLGFGKATGTPGVFVCTSGTAVANAYPAVIEASAEDVPMLLLTADRPPELRGTGANQTIDQVKLFGEYPRYFKDLDCPDDGSIDERLRDEIRSAVQQAQTGPVHVNCMIREPFGANDELKDECRSTTPDLPTQAMADSEVPSSESSIPTIQGGNCVVIVSACSRDDAFAGKQLAERIGCPLVADVTSGLRAIPHDFAVLRLCESLPDCVIHLGRRITSKRLLQYLAKAAPKEYIHVSRTEKKIDPNHQVTKTLVGNVASICERIEPRKSCDGAFFRAWNSAAAETRTLVDEFLADGKVSEPAVAHSISKHLPAEHGLFLGSSMPIRDMDSFGEWPKGEHRRVAANRGASGIDGNLATAVGFAGGLRSPATVLLGDLATLHDLNSLALVAESEFPLVAVVINNDGGGIFHFLPIATQTKHFESFFAMPHGRNFSDAAKMFEISYASLQGSDSLEDFNRTYVAATSRKTSTIIEVFTDRAENHQLHQRILERIGKT